MMKNLKKLRIEKGISQQQLAEIIGVTQQSIYKYETQNVEPDFVILCALADYFSTSVDYLIGHSEVNHKIEKVSLFDLNEDEAKLITSYRKLNRSEKQSIHLIIKNYTVKA